MALWLNLWGHLPLAQGVPGRSGRTAPPVPLVPRSVLRSVWSGRTDTRTQSRPSGVAALGNMVVVPQAGAVEGQGVGAAPAQPQLSGRLHRLP